MKYIVITLTIITIIPFSGCRKAPPSEEPTVHVSYKKIRDMSLDEALLARTYYKERGQQELSNEALERAISLSEYHHQTEGLVLELADSYLEMGEYEKAQVVYKQFKSFYPGSAHIEYALYQELLSYQLASLSSDRDQTATQTTITLAQAFLERFETSEYVPSVKTTLALSYKDILEHELNQVDFYITKFNYDVRVSPLVAARNRLQFIKDKVLSELQEFNKVECEQHKTLIAATLSAFDDITQNGNHTQEVLLQQSQELLRVSHSLHALCAPIKIDAPKKHPRDRF